MASDTTTFQTFTLTARAGVGNIRSMFRTISDELGANADGACVSIGPREMEILDPIEGASPELIRDVVGPYASQLEDTEPNLAATENNGNWFWQIKDGKYRQTGAVLTPDEEHWNDGRDG
jgi:hypothetical protein